MARKSKSKPEPRLSRLPDRAKFVRIVTTTTTILLFLGLSLGLLIGRGTLQARAAEVVREPVQVRFSWPPLTGSTQPNQTWLDEATRHKLQALALQHLSADPFDAASLTKARQAIAATGWFASGPILRRESAGVIRVEGKWRVPFAVVRVGSSDHLVTLRGEILEPVYPANASRLPVILGAPQAAPARLGDVWSGTNVHAGLNLLWTLRSYPWFSQIAGVDVGGKPPLSSRELVIVTKNGRIRWGGPVDAPLPGEQPTAVKLRHLESLVARTGQLDGNQTELVDIRLHLVGLGESAPIRATAADPGAVQSGR